MNYSDLIKQLGPNGLLPDTRDELYKEFEEFYAAGREFPPQKIIPLAGSGGYGVENPDYDWQLDQYKFRQTEFYKEIVKRSNEE